MSRSTIIESAEHAVFVHFEPLLEPVKRLVNAANFDLYFGPYSEGNEPDGDGWKYPGFGEACKAISDAMDGVSEVWVDTDCDCVMENEPEGEEIDGEYYYPSWDSIYHFERRDVLRILLGKELPSYI